MGLIGGPTIAGVLPPEALGVGLAGLTGVLFI